MFATVIRQVINADSGGMLRRFEGMGQSALLNLVGGGGSPLGIALNAYLKFAKITTREATSDAIAQQREEDKPLTAAEKRAGKIRHQEWLRDNRWRFDWRSQPRRPAGSDAGGEWMEGRLDYQAETKKAFSRSVMRRRTRSMRQYKQRMKAMGNTHTRTIRSAWGDF
jgi:hypothetical protein